MDSLLIQGGKRLEGNVLLSGSKNSALPIIVGAALGTAKVTLENVPLYTDTYRLCAILEELGVEAKFTGGNVLEINGKGLSESRAPYDIVRKLRASFYVTGLLLSRLGVAEVPFPGGDVIGARGIDFHINGFRAMGAEVIVEHGYVKAKAKKLHGADIYIGRSSMGATVNLMLAATCAEGVTTLENAAREPEIVDLAILLNRMGAKIKGAGTGTIKIKGVEGLTGTVHEIIPDRIEAGTFIALAIGTGSRLTVQNCEPDHLRTVILKAQEAGAEITEGVGEIKVCGPERPRALSYETSPYPGFPTDLQPQFSAMLTCAEGVSSVRETIWENRFGYADELRRMGAILDVDRDSMIVRGVERLSGAPVESPPDIRGAVALLIAGLMAEGETELKGIHHIDRGYYNIEDKLRSLGAMVTRVSLED